MDSVCLLVPTGRTDETHLQIEFTAAHYRKWQAARAVVNSDEQFESLTLKGHYYVKARLLSLPDADWSAPVILPEPNATGRFPTTLFVTVSYTGITFDYNNDKGATPHLATEHTDLVVWDEIFLANASLSAHTFGMVEHDNESPEIPWPLPVALLPGTYFPTITPDDMTTDYRIYKVEGHTLTTLRETEAIEPGTSFVLLPHQLSETLTLSS